MADFKTGVYDLSKNVFRALYLLYPFIAYSMYEGEPDVTREELWGAASFTFALLVIFSELVIFPYLQKLTRIEVMQEGLVHFGLSLQTKTIPYDRLLGPIRTPCGFFTKYAFKDVTSPYEIAVFTSFTENYLELLRMIEHNREVLTVKEEPMKTTTKAKPAKAKKKTAVKKPAKAAAKKAVKTSVKKAAPKKAGKK